jgi:prevent-host-death family protein
VLHKLIVEKIGIRELRQRASEWVAKAKAGKVILITDRGQPVARLMPLTRNENARNKLIGWSAHPGRCPKSSLQH